MERMLVSGVALDRDCDRIALIGLQDRPGIAFRVFDVLAKAGINLDVIIQSIGRDNTEDISFTLPDDRFDEAVQILNDNKDWLTFKSMDVERDIAKLSIVGSGMMSNPGVAAKMFEALYNANVNINMISTSEIRVTVLIDEKDAVRATNAVHEAFGLED